MMAVDPQHVGFGKAVADTLGTKNVCRPVGFGKVARAIYQEQRPAADLEIARIGECVNEPANVVAVVLARIHLGLEDVALFSEPPARPGFVSPGEAERKIGLAG